MEFKIRELAQTEIPALDGFAPPEWNSDLVEFFSFHSGHDYFYPAAAESDGRIIGCGCVIQNDTAGWLGNIIVIPEYRRLGIGEAITKHLMNYLTENNCRHQILIATQMGEPVYFKLGFKFASNYLFFKKEKHIEIEVSQDIKPLEQRHILSIKKLDESVTGERRSSFIERFYRNAFVHFSPDNNSIDGYYLSELGNGFIAAETEQVGIELLKFKIASGSEKIIIPDANLTAGNFLIENGFAQYLSCPRMVLSNELNWKPRLIFSRGSGYSG